MTEISSFSSFFAGFSASSTEQQEKLKLVYDRFREEVERHLVDCRCSLEDLEAYEEELKGNVDRQSTRLSLPLPLPQTHLFGYQSHPSEAHHLFDSVLRDKMGWVFIPPSPTVLEAVDLDITCRHKEGNRWSSLSADVVVTAMRPVGRHGLGRSNPPGVKGPDRKSGDLSGVERE